MGDKDQVFNQIQELLQQPGADVNAIKQEMVEQFQLAAAPATTVQNVPENTAATTQLTEAISKLKVSQSTKIPKYVKSDNFSRYCERFQEYVLISRVESPNLHMYFLQNVDDETYSQLRDVELNDQQKADPVQFCEAFKKAIYGDVSISLKNEVMECRQKADEDIAKYAYRLREKAIVAYDNPATADENCLIAFLRGVKDINIRRKLNEATSLTAFKDAVKMAKRLEKVNEIIGEENEVSSILKENAPFSFRPKRDTSHSPPTREHSEGRSRSPYHYRSNSPRDSYPRRERSRSRDRHNYDYDRNRRNSYDRYRHRSSSRESRGSNRSGSRSPMGYRSSDRYRSRSRGSPRDFTYRDRSRTPDPRQKSRDNYRYGDNYKYRNSSDRYGDAKSKTITCWRCNKQGHISRDCWLNKVKHFAGDRPNCHDFDTNQCYSGMKTPNAGYGMQFIPSKLPASSSVNYDSSTSGHNSGTSNFETHNSRTTTTSHSNCSPLN